MSSARFQSAQRNLAYATAAERRNFSNYVNQVQADYYASNQRNRSAESSSSSSAVATGASILSGPVSSGGTRANNSAATVGEAMKDILSMGTKLAGTPYNRIMHHEFFNGSNRSSGRRSRGDGVPNYVRGY